MVGGGSAVRRSGRRGRLSSSAEFDRVLRRGRSRANRWLVLYAFPRPQPEIAGAVEPRLGLSVSRRVGGAVERNRLKRLLREALRAEAHRLPDGYDLVVVARPTARELGEREGLHGVRRALGDLLDGESDGSPPS